MELSALGRFAWSAALSVACLSATAMATHAAPLVICSDGPHEAAAARQLAVTFDAATIQHRPTARCPRQGDRGRFLASRAGVQFVLTAAHGAQIQRAVPLQTPTGPLAALAQAQQLDAFRLRLFGLLLDVQTMPAPKPKPVRRRRPRPPVVVAAPKPTVVPTPPPVMGPPPPPEPPVVLPARPAPAPRPAVTAQVSPPAVPSATRERTIQAQLGLRWRQPGVVGNELAVTAGWGPWWARAHAQPETRWTVGPYPMGLRAAGSTVAWAPALNQGRVRWRLPVQVGIEVLGLERVELGAHRLIVALQLGLGLRAQTTLGPVRCSLGADAWFAPIPEAVRINDDVDEPINLFGAGVHLGLGWGR